MSEAQLYADLGAYLLAAVGNGPPPVISSDSPITGSTPIEQLLQVLVLAANADDPADNAESLEQYTRRDAMTGEAAEKFARQDEDSARELADAGESEAIPQLAQQLPQLVSGIAGGLAGAMGGALQPFVQFPQQVAQGAQQALQSGLGLLGQAGSGLAASGVPVGAMTSPQDRTESAADDFSDTTLSGTDSESDSANPAPEADLLDGDAGGLSPPLGAAGILGGTAPTAVLGPPPVPSPSTAPAAAAPLSPAVPAAPPAPATPTGGMAGVPMVPPGPLQPGVNPIAGKEGGREGGKEGNADTKRVAVPPVRNGAPVQGRLTAAPPSVTADDTPVVTRRLVIPPD